MGNPSKVLLITEGTYPFNGGGVSTWSHLLCSELTSIDFTIYSINAAFESQSKYDLPSNVSEVFQVPLWTADEPFDYIDYGDSYTKIVGKKEWTTANIVLTQFVPLFEQLLQFIYGEQKDLAALDRVIHDLWLYFEDYDYKETMRSKPVWIAYKKVIEQMIIPDRNPNATMMDLTVGMRWVYRFLMPLAITDVPKTDIAHLTLSGFPTLAALIAHYKHAAKIVLTEHGVFIRERLLAINNSEYPYFLKNLLIKFSEAIARLCYYKADRILSVNEFNRKWEKWYGADPKKIQVIYNGIDTEVFQPRAKPEEFKGIPTVVALARVFELKDIITMIKSCRVVVDHIPNAQYLIYGDDKAVPEYTKACLDLIDELQLQNHLKFMGPRKDPHLLFSHGDVSILTSISEGFPYTVIESMASGIPVVATDVGGVKEALDQGSGFLCKPKNSQEIGMRVVELLKDTALRQQMAAHGRQRVIENFSIQTFTAGYSDAYKSLIPVDELNTLAV